MKKRLVYEKHFCSQLTLFSDAPRIGGMFYEACSTARCMKLDVCKDTVSEMLKNCKLSFPGKEHANELLAYCTKYYVRMQIRQYS